MFSNEFKFYDILCDFNFYLNGKRDTDKKLRQREKEKEQETERKEMK